MECLQCKTPNRQVAKYCKRCGVTLAQCSPSTPRIWKSLLKEYCEVR
jgi:hypothetical protein